MTEPPTDYQCGDSCKGECSGEVTGILHCPHSSATEPAPLCECTHIPTQGEFIAEFVGNEQKKRDDHDTAIAQAERERVLDLLIAYRTAQSKEFGIQTVWEGEGIYILELRQQEEQR